ncbi:MAG: sigma-70 family RNA polymerase sigma factor [Saprospiraceae bacterium]|nr:sigma-70 family RNA polymerase sigma factor [Saprospiraceae bacterium]
MTETTFLQIAQRNQDKLFRFARRLLKDVSAAEDAVQDLLAKLWNKRHALNAYENIDVFMMVAMKNHCFDEIKKSKRRTQHYALHAVENTAKVATPERQVEGITTVALVSQLIDELPETQRMVMQLRDIEQLELKEIEDILGLQPNAVRTNLSRARKKVREKLKKIHNYGLE